MPSSAFFVFGTVAGTLQRSTQLWTLRAARPATAARGTEPDGGAFGHRCLGSCKRARARRYPPWPGCRNQCPFWDTVFRILAQGTPQKKTGQIPALKGAHLMFQHALGVLLPRSPAPPLALQSFLCKNAPLLKAGVARGGGGTAAQATPFLHRWFARPCGVKNLPPHRRHGNLASVSRRERSCFGLAIYQHPAKESVSW